MKKHTEIIERMMFAMANHTVDGKRIYPTLKVAKEAVEKQMPKRPKTLKTHDISNYKYGDCECGEHICDDERYCSSCGQAIDWSESN